MKKLSILLFLTILLTSKLSFAGAFIQGGLGLNTYIGKDNSFNGKYFPLVLGYSSKLFDFGGTFSYSNFTADNFKNSLTSDNLDVYSLGIMANYKPITFYNITPYVGLGLTYNIFNGTREKPLLDKNPSQNYIKDHNCSLKTNDPSNIFGTPHYSSYYSCAGDINFNNVTADFRAGLQYAMTPYVKLIGGIIYSQRLNNDNDSSKNYNMLHYSLSVRIELP